MEKTIGQGMLSKMETTPSKPIDLMAEKAEIFSEMKAHLPELRKYINEPITTGGPIADVFDASIEDGLNLAKKLRLTPEEIQKLTLLKNHSFAIHHEKILTCARDKARDIGVPEDDLKNFGLGNVVRSRETGDVVEAWIRVHQDEREKFSPEVTNLTAKIEDYYKEFLPYRFDPVPDGQKHKEQKRVFDRYEIEKNKLKGDLRRAEDILFKKYVPLLEEELSIGRDSLLSRLTQNGMLYKEAVRIADMVQEEKDTAMHSGMAEVSDTNEEKELRTVAFPSIVMSIRGERREFNLDKERKPVQKIIERITKNELIKDVNNLVKDKGYDSSLYCAEKDPILDRYIITNTTRTPLKNHEREENRIQLSRIVAQFNSFFATAGDPKSDSLSDLESWTGEIMSTDEGKAFEKGLNIGTSNAEIPLEDNLDAYADVKNKNLRRFLEEKIIAEKISGNKYLGVAATLDEMSKGVRPTVLTPVELDELKKKLDSATSHVSDFPGSYSDSEFLLHVVNLMEKPTFENLSKHFMLMNRNFHSDEQVKETKSLKERVVDRLRFLNFVRIAATNKVSGLLSTISAKEDKAPYEMANRLIKACYPKEWSAYEERQKELEEERKARQSAYSSSSTYDGGRNGPGSGPGSSDGGITHNRFESTLGGGNVGSKEFQEGAPSKIASFDTPVQGMFVTNILGYDPVARIWKRNYVAIDGDNHQDRPTERVTAKLAGPIGRIIPAPIGVKGFETKGGSNSHIAQDSLGLLNLEGSRDIESWSYEIPQGTLAPIDVDENTYTRFLSRFINENGAPYLEKNPDLPLEAKMFVDGIKTLSPRERFIKIQGFVTGASFYDSYDNPIRDKMNVAPFASRVELMKERLDQLRDQLGEDVPDTALFAGVCADFSMVTESMYREAGLASCVIEGYNMNGTEMDSHSAHAKTGVFWPDHSGKTILVEVETTPNAVTPEQVAAYEQQGIAPAPLALEIKKAEKEQVQQAKISEAEIRTLEEELEEKMRLLEESGAESLSVEGRNILTEQTKSLSQMIASYIDHSATIEDVAVLKGILKSIRFSSVLKEDQGSVDTKINNITFVQSEYARLEKEYFSREEPLERISHIGKNFMGDLNIELFSASAAKESVAFIDYVGKVGEYGGRKIPENHRKIWSMLRTYMKAKLA